MQDVGGKKWRQLAVPITIRSSVLETKIDSTRVTIIFVEMFVIGALRRRWRDTG